MPADDLRPLDAAEERFLRSFARVLLTVPRALDEQLTRDAGTSTNDDFALMHLSEPPNGACGWASSPRSRTSP